MLEWNENLGMKLLDYMFTFYFHLFYISTSNGWRSQWLYNLTNNYFMCFLFMIVATFVAINRSLTVGLIYIFLIGLMLNIFSHHYFIIYIIYSIYIYFFEDFIHYILIILNSSNTHFFFFPTLDLFFFSHFRNRGIVFWFWSCKGFYILWIFKSYELTFKYFPIVYTDWLPFW